MKKDFVEGAKAATPIILGYIPVGIAYGMLAKATGLTFFKALSFSLFVYTGAGQMAAVTMLAQNAAYVTIVFTVVTAASKGRTVGKALVNIRLVNGTNENIMADRTNFKEAGIFRLFFRYIILYMIELPSLIYAYGLYKLTETATGWEYVFYGIGCGIFIIIAAYFVVDLVLCLFSDTRNMIYDRITGITHMNMVKK